MEYLYLGLLLGYVILALIDASHFVEYHEKMKRGIKVGSEKLPTHLEYYLRNLPSDILGNQTTAFIKKRGQIVLIQPITDLLHSNIGLWYIGYVDFSTTEARIDYRAPISAVSGIVIATGIFIFKVFDYFQNGILPAILVLIIMIPWLMLGHAHSKKVVRRYIERNQQGDS
ncbi:hypothetical protein ANRL4_04760 [Anaerolineae bacterium]|nr:hypothetical protein ANRL4_04760 [Anaerolineae bacterium]